MAPMKSKELQGLSRELFNAERSRSPITPLTDRFPNMTPADAYQVQIGYVKMKKESGARVVGRKVGLTSKAMQKLLKVDQPDYGILFDTMMVEDCGVIEASSLIRPKIEVEIAFVLGKDLAGPGISAHQVLAATDFILPTFEIIDSRIKDWKIKLEDTVSDNASFARFILGGKPVSVHDKDLRLEGMVMERNGEIVGMGVGAAVLDHPANAVAWLANKFSETGESLGAGEVIISGALTAAIDVSSGDYMQARFTHLGSVSVRFK